MHMFIVDIHTCIRNRCVEHYQESPHRSWIAMYTRVVVLLLHEKPGE